MKESGTQLKLNLSGALMTLMLIGCPMVLGARAETIAHMFNAVPWTISQFKLTQPVVCFAAQVISPVLWYLSESCWHRGMYCFAN